MNSTFEEQEALDHPAMTVANTLARRTPCAARMAIGNPVWVRYKFIGKSVGIGEDFVNSTRPTGRLLRAQQPDQRGFAAISVEEFSFTTLILANRH